MLLRTPIRHACVIAVIAAACLFGVPLADAQKANPFMKFGGSWTGSGLIYFSNGNKERIRCRAGFTPGDTFNAVSLKLELRCAGDAYTFELHSELNYDSGSVTGTWTELARGVNGNVTGTINGDQINAVAESQTFTATLELISLGDKQQVRITSPGSEMTDVLIGLNRAVRPASALPQ
jgi:hypothetical protein